MKKFFLRLVVVLVLGTCVVFGAAKEKTAFASANFSDLENSHIFYDEIHFLASENLISGFPDGTFKPGQTVTRAQAAMMIGKALQLDGEPKNTDFKDVNPAVTGSGYIAAAVEKGIITGFPDRTFRPYESVTRGQMAILLNRAFSLTTGQVNYFRDVSSNMAAYQAIINVFESGIAGGYPDGTFRPNHPVTRGEFSAFMARVLEPSFRNTKSNDLAAYINEEILLNGVSLDLTKQEVVARLGEPLSTGIDDMYEEYYVYKLKNSYDNTVSDVYISFYGGRVISISFAINNGVFGAQWYKNLGQPFATMDGITYFYLPGKEQLLMFKPNEGHAYIVYADNNFYYWFGMHDKMQ